MRIREDDGTWRLKTGSSPSPRIEQAARRITLDDKMTFFQQLSTLVSSGTPLLQALQICAEQSQSLKLRRVLDQIAGRVAAGSSVHAAADNYPERLPASLGRGHSHRRNHRPNGPRAAGIEQARSPKPAADRPQGQRRADVSDDHDRCRLLAHRRHALARGPHVRQNVQGHGRRTARHHPIRRQLSDFLVHTAFSSCSASSAR